MRMPLIAGNWKLFKTIKQSVELVEELIKEVGGVYDREIVVCPVFTALFPVSKVIENSVIKLGAQDVYYMEEGAFTGEVAPLMLKDAGCRYVIIGHSERRTLFGETDALINKKAKAALEAGLIPIICVGESLSEKETGRTLDVVEHQTREAFKDILTSNIEKCVIAYEPIWAIGTGKSDSPQGAQETIASIRRVIATLVGEEVSSKVRILYGGSVKPENIDGYMKEKDIDGALVGGASLKPDSFGRIVKYE